MKKIKITTIILAIILVALVAFAGVYVKTQNRMENKVKEYSFGRELDGGRIIELTIANLNNEESKPDEKTLTVENYETVKKTIENRLNNLGVEDYTISLNKENGTIRVELEENDNTDIYVHYLTASGKVQIKEDETNVELLSDSMIQKATYTYSSDIEGQYQVFVELYLTEEGQAKIEEIKNNYAILATEVEEIETAKSDKEADKEKESEEATTEENTTEDVETKKIAKLTIGGNEYDVDKIEENKIRISMGPKTSNSSYINSYISLAAESTMLINAGKMPLEYETADNRLEYTNITNTQMLYFEIAIIVVLFIMFITLIVEYKAKGLLVSISYIGFVSIFSLLIRYTNVNISIEGIGAIILVLIFNIRINQMILENAMNTKNINEVIVDTYKEVFLKLVPIIIITLVFCFAGVANLSSFGMVMFWGLVLIAAYNATVTKTLLKLKESK